MVCAMASEEEPYDFKKIIDSIIKIFNSTSVIKIKAISEIKEKP